MEINQKSLKFPCEIIILLVSGDHWATYGLRIATLGAKTIYRSRPIYEVSSFSHGKRYGNDLSDADNMLGHKNKRGLLAVAQSWSRHIVHEASFCVGCYWVTLGKGPTGRRRQRTR